MSDKTLKPCPFCESEAVLDKVDEGADYRPWFWYTIHCSNRDCVCADLCHEYETEAEAIAAWNIRAELESDKIARLKNELNDLDDTLNEMAEKWAIAQVQAEDYEKRCKLLEELSKQSHREQTIHCRDCSKWHHIDTENEIRYGECDEWKRPDSCFVPVTREDGFCYCGKERTD